MPDKSPPEPRRSFDAVTAIYGAIRPTYPSALFDDLFRLLPPRPLVLEVGPGTGQATNDLLRRGAIVHAVEIGTTMAATLRATLSSHDLTITVGDFETVVIEERSADALFAATAYHWISPAAQLERPAAILRSGGRMAIVDLIQIAAPEDNGFFTAAQPIYERYGQGHDGPPAPARGAVDPAIRTALAGDGRFADVTVRSYDWNQTYSASEYRQLMSSYSNTRMMTPSMRQGLLDDIERFVDERFGGQVTRPLVVTLTTASVIRAHS